MNVGYEQNGEDYLRSSGHRIGRSFLQREIKFNYPITKM